MNWKALRQLIFSKNIRLHGALLLSLLCWGYGALVTADSGPIIPRGKGDQCVAPNAEMRRNHMEFILHQRDETVLKGIRTEPFSLSECVNCHAQNGAQGQAIRIDHPGQFCESCHAYAAVNIDCFSCHRAVPDDTQVDPSAQ